MCEITYLYSESRLLGKQFISENGQVRVVPYDLGYKVYNDTKSYYSLAEVFNDFTELAADRRFCFVRGNIKPAYRGKPCRRLLRDDPTTGDAATIEMDPVGLRLIMLDLDQIDNPGGGKPGVSEIERLVIDRLPAEFKPASYFFQFSSSAGLKGWDTFKLHMFFWTREPWTDHRLRGWAQAYNERLGERFIDDRVFLSSQINYLANPLFLGMDDPLGDDRWGLVLKAEPAVDLQPIPRSQPRRDPEWAEWSSRPTITLGDIEERLRLKLAAVGQGGQFRAPLMAAIRFYVAACKRRGQCPDHASLMATIHQQVGGILRNAGRSDYLTNRHLADIITWMENHVHPAPHTDAERVARKLRNARQQIMAGTL